MNCLYNINKVSDILMNTNNWFVSLQAPVIILNPKPRNINMYANELVRRYEGNVYDRIFHNI